jgi:hypothetical protein
MPRRNAYQMRSAWVCQIQYTHEVGPAGLNRTWADVAARDGLTAGAQC